MLDSKQYLIDSCVENLNITANRNGYTCISEETLVKIIEAYKQKHTPPKTPTGGARQVNIETLISDISQPEPSNIVYLDLKKAAK